MKVFIDTLKLILVAVKRLAKQRRVPRNQALMEANQECLASYNSSEVTARLDEIYGVEVAVVDFVLLSAQYAVLYREAW